MAGENGALVPRGARAHGDAAPSAASRWPARERVRVPIRRVDSRCARAVCTGKEAGPPSPSAGQLIELALGSVPLVAVPGLQLPDELIPLAGGLVQVVVGQVAPLLLDLPLELLPIALDPVPIHGSPPDEWRVKW